jgi:uncharacterized protein YkwD
MILLLLLVTAASAFAEPVAPVEALVVERVNEIRRPRGAAPLRVDAALTALAREHSCRMAREKEFSHDTGGTLRERVRAAGIRYRAIGENLAQITTDAEPVERAITAWMKSEGHRANLVSPEFTTTGVGVCRPGRMYYFTQIFLHP